MAKIPIDLNVVLSEIIGQDFLNLLKKQKNEKGQPVKMETVRDLIDFITVCAEQGKSLRQKLLESEDVGVFQIGKIEDALIQGGYGYILVLHKKLYDS